MIKSSTFKGILNDPNAINNLHAEAINPSYVYEGNIIYLSYIIDNNHLILYVKHEKVLRSLLQTIADMVDLVNHLNGD